MLSKNQSIGFAVVPLVFEEISYQEICEANQRLRYITETDQLINISEVPLVHAVNWGDFKETNIINIDEANIINNFYQKYCGCSRCHSNTPQIEEIDAQECSFYIPPDQKIRNYHEFLRSEEIERMKLPKHEMYDLLLQPFNHDCIIQTDEQNFKVKYLYRCKYGECNKFFTKGWNVLDHVRMHEDLRPYQCEFCNRAFTQKCNLTKHRQRHLVTSMKERKRFKCCMCDKSFTERYNLRVRSL